MTEQHPACAKKAEARAISHHHLAVNCHDIRLQAGEPQAGQEVPERIAREYQAPFDGNVPFQKPIFVEDLCKVRVG
jgi:hypothetical protein